MFRGFGRFRGFNAAIGRPGDFSFVNNQNAGQRLDFVAEKAERERAGQKGRILENDAPKRDIGRRLGKCLADIEVRRDFFSGKNNRFGNGQNRLPKHDGRLSAAVRLELDLPRPLEGAAMLDPREAHDVQRDGDGGGQRQMFDKAVVVFAQILDDSGLRRNAT